MLPDKWFAAFPKDLIMCSYLIICTQVFIFNKGIRTHVPQQPENIFCPTEKGDFSQTCESWNYFVGIYFYIGYCIQHSYCVTHCIHGALIYTYYTYILFRTIKS